MATLRPLKEGSVRTYQEKVALGFPDILASEMDADLDTIYAAWNSTAGGDLQGNYPNPTIRPSALPWTPSGATLTPTDTTKRVVIPTGGGTCLEFGPLTAKGRLTEHPSAPLTSLTHNLSLLSGGTWASDDAAKPSWRLDLRTDTDLFGVLRAAAGAPNTFATLLQLDSTGSLTIQAPTAASNVSQLGGLSAGHTLRSYRGTLAAPTTIQSGDIFAQVLLGGYAGNAYQDAVLIRGVAVETWSTTARGCNFTVNTISPGQTTWNGQLTFDANGNLTISGNVGQKASGTTWANPSDIRIKKNIAPYTQGLDAILALEPKTFEFNGLGGSRDGLAGIGLIANDVQPVMPEMVSTTPTKLSADDESPVDLLTLDTTALQLALVNAVKELAARVAALEAGPST